MPEVHLGVQLCTDLLYDHAPLGGIGEFPSFLRIKCCYLARPATAHCTISPPHNLSSDRYLASPWHRSSGREENEQVWQKLMIRR